MQLILRNFELLWFDRSSCEPFSCLSFVAQLSAAANERVWNSSTSLLTWHACRTATISIWGTHTHTFHTWVGNVGSAVQCLRNHTVHVALHSAVLCVASRPLNRQLCRIWLNWNCFRSASLASCVLLSVCTVLILPSVLSHSQSQIFITFSS